MVIKTSRDDSNDMVIPPKQRSYQPRRQNRFTYMHLRADFLKPHAIFNKELVEITPRFTNKDSGFHLLEWSTGQHIYPLDGSFQMTVESNYVIAIATLSDWLKRLAPVFQPMRSKTKTNRTMDA